MIFSLIALFLAVASPDDSEAPDIVVTSLADSGAGSLRQAIADVPANGTIRFAVEGDILLTSGELLVDKPLRFTEIPATSTCASFTSRLARLRLAI